MMLAHVGHQSAPAALGQVTLACGLIVFFLADQLAWRRARQAVGRRRALRLLVAVFAPATALLPELWALAALTLAVLASVAVGRGATDGDRSGTRAGCLCIFRSVVTPADWIRAVRPCSAGSGRRRRRRRQRVAAFWA